MKFIRFGDIKAFEQKYYKRCPGIDEYAHAPPRRKGFFAFPYAFFDPCYIIRHPACEPHSPLRYLRDEKGRKLTRRDVGDVSAEVLLKEFGLPKQPIVYEERPSWVCIMRDPRHPPIRTRSGRLNQKFDYLTDIRGDRVKAEVFFDRDWCLGDFDDERLFHHCKPSDINHDALYYMDVYEKYDDFMVYSDDRVVKMTVDYLSKRGIRIESLFAWPLYEEGEDAFVAVYKKPRLFDYKGCVWHHLRKFVPQGAVLAAYGTTWVYTTMRDFEGALRHANPKVYARHKNSQAKAKASRFGGPNCCNGEIDVDGMYEVFFDEEDIKKIS